MATYKKVLKNRAGDTIIPVTDADTYSTNEKKVGVWIDGKPIYRKTIVLDFTSVPAAGLTWNHGISNFSKMIAHDIVFNLGWDRTFYGDSAYLARNGMALRIGSTQIALDTNAASNWKGTIYYTVYYTKSTD